jgi:hypothetical protein
LIDGIRVRYERQTRARVGYLTYRHIRVLSHESQNREDHKSGQKACAFVEASQYECVSVAVIAEFIVAA